MTSCNKPLISIIVPIYNVERWLKKCLKSLQKQTFSNIEVVLIDDGSTDSSGMIAKEFTSDPRFKYIYTDNHGLSSARNLGIEISSADWIMFADGDDWVDDNFCAIPYEIAVNSHSDIVIFEYSKVYISNLIHNSQEYSVFSIDYETAIDIGECMVWNKLYRKTLFTELVYPEGRVYEDVAITHKLIYRANKISYCSKKLYFYRIRQGSISHTTESRRDEYKSKIERARDLESYGYPRDKAKTQLIIASLAYYGQAYDENDPLFVKALELLECLQDISLNIKFKHRMMMLIWKKNRQLYRFIYWILGKRMKKS